VDETQKLAAEQFANIEVIKFMMLDMWSIYILNQDSPEDSALLNRERHLRQLQKSIDTMPESLIANSLLDNAENNWVQIFRRLTAEGVRF
jgi:hypothetical protein